MAYKLEETENMIKSLTDKIKKTDDLIKQLDEIGKRFVDSNEVLNEHRLRISDLLEQQSKFNGSVNEQIEMINQMVVKQNNETHQMISESDKYVKQLEVSTQIAINDVKKEISTMDQSIKNQFLEIQVDLNKKVDRLMDSINLLSNSMIKEINVVKVTLGKEEVIQRKRFKVIVVILVIVGTSVLISYLF